MDTFPIVLSTYIEGLKSHDVDKVGRCVAADLAFITTVQTIGKEQFLGMLRGVYAGFPDWHYEHGAAEYRQEVIAVRFRQGGRHTGTFALPGQSPVPPTGKLVKIPEHYFFYKLRDDQIIEIRPEPVPGGAPLGILEQIGARWSPLS